MQAARTRQFRWGARTSWVDRVGKIACLAAFLAVCFVSLVPADAESPLASYGYPLATGDKLKVTVFGEPDLSGDFAVDSLGSLSLPLIGRVRAAGLNASELEAVIVEKLKDGYLRNPRVIVQVPEYRPFYVVGDVKTPGSHGYVNGITMIGAIALSGGYSVTTMDDIRTRLAVRRARENLDLILGDYHVAIVREARLLAERDGLDEIRFPQEILQDQIDPKLVEMIEGERRVFTSRRESLTGAESILKEKISQHREVISALKAQVRSKDYQSDLLRIEIEDVETLLGKGLTTKARLHALQRKFAVLEGDRRAHRANIARTRLNISETELNIVKLRNDLRKDVVAQLQDVQNQISELEKRIAAAKDVLRENSVAAAHTRQRLISRKSSRIVITRVTAEGPTELEVNENSPVFPGDIIRVLKSEDSGSDPQSDGIMMNGNLDKRPADMDDATNSVDRASGTSRKAPETDPPAEASKPEPEVDVAPVPVPVVVEPPATRKAHVAPPAAPDASPVAPPAEIAVAQSPSTQAGAPRATPPNVQYMTQLAAYRDAMQADRGWETLKRKFPRILKGMSYRVRKVDFGANKGFYYRLQAGSFGSRAAALEVCNELIVLKQACMVVRR